MNRLIHRIHQSDLLWRARFVLYYGPELHSYKFITETYQQQYQRLGQLNYNEDQAIESTFNGRIDELIILSGKGVSLHKKLLAIAARAGHRNIVEWLLQHNLIASDWVVGQAARGGHFDLVKWLTEKSIQVTNFTIASAVYSAPVEILDCLFQHNTEPVHLHSRASISGGNIPAIEWMSSHGLNFTLRDTNTAALKGNAGVLE